MDLRINTVTPAMGIPGGEVVIQCDGFDCSIETPGEVLFGGDPGETVSCSENRVIARIAGTGSGSGVALKTDEGQTKTFPFLMGQRIADELHPVCNPIMDRYGDILVTLSGSRGQKVPFSVFKITMGHEKEPYLADIINPSGMAFDVHGDLYISSRQDGIVYKVDENRHIKRFADNLGTATGLVFDAEGYLYVGDRSGSIIRLDPDGTPMVYATLEPSISAYHMAFGPDGRLYVSGPTLSSQDTIYCIESNGEVKPFFRGLGRPQGLVFDHQGYLYVGASYLGAKGVWKLDWLGQIEHFIAGPVMVGLVFDAYGNLYLADTHSLYYLPLGSTMPS